MHSYQICILNEALKTKAFIALSEASDAAAIQTGIRIAGSRGVEVWHDLMCIYRAVPGKEPILHAA